MTALCGGGASGPKPGINELVIFGSSELASLLNNKGGFWATLAIGVLGVVTYDVTQLCATDPPATPTISSAEYDALLNLSPPDVFATAVGKLIDLAKIIAWYELCQCNSVATPVLPSNTLAPPSGVTIQDYSSSPCVSPRALVTWFPPRTNADDSNNITRELFPNLDFVRSANASTFFPGTDIAAIPSNWASLDSFTSFVSGNVPGADPYAVDLYTYGADKGIGTLKNAGVVDQIATTHRDPSSGSTNFNHTTEVYFSVHARVGGTTVVQGSANYELNIHCSGTPVAPISCMSDPVLKAMLDQLLQCCGAIKTQVDTLQRYGLPFAYVTGGVTGGLGGTGSQALGRSVGLKLDVTSYPLTNKTQLGQPTYILDLGWVSVSTPDGLVDEIRLTRQHTTWLSKLIPSATLVGWGLRSGVTLQITELHAEPFSTLP